MELFLNIAWALLTAALTALWLRFGPRGGADRRLQLVALIVLLLVLFPVISVSDDLLSVQSPAEADSCLRRDNCAATAYVVLPSAADLPLPFLADLPHGAPQLAVSREIVSPARAHTGLAEIDNRPPPGA